MQVKKYKLRMFKFKTKLVLEQFNKNQARFNFDLSHAE